VRLPGRGRPDEDDQTGIGETQGSDEFGPLHTSNLKTMGAPSAGMQEEDLLAAARGGDEPAFRHLVELHRRELHAHCYRMMGSLHDAEDALQDALLRAWRGLPRFEGRSSTGSWLYRIVTNACLDALARRPKRVLPIDYGPAGGPGDDPGSPVGESCWLEPYPDQQHGVEDGYASPDARYEQREAVELAFIAALQHLPARQRAVLILRDVLGFSAREVGEALDSTPTSVNSALQRARRTLDERLPETSQQATLRTLGDDCVRDLVERFTSAFERDDVPAIVSLLSEDAKFAMPPYPGWYQGRAAIADSWLMPGGPPPRLRYVSTSANAQPALATYRLDEDKARYLPIALDVLTLRGPWIAEVLAFRTPEVFPRFGLPAAID
jgi:RNA polymerase sigma-70 factor, ECF subfamily